MPQTHAESGETGAFRWRWRVAILTVLLALGMSTTVGCCAEVLPSRPLGKTEIHRLPNGNWEVSAGWMVRRVRYERAILDRCPSPVPAD